MRPQSAAAKAASRESRTRTALSAKEKTRTGRTVAKMPRSFPAKHVERLTAFDIWSLRVPSSFSRVKAS